MFAFFNCVAEAVVENGVKGLAGMIPGGAFALAVASGALAKYKERKRDAALREEIRLMAEATATESRKAAAETVQAVAGAVNGDERAALESYLAQIPAAVNQSLKRPNDPTGRTVPAAFALTTPDDMLRLLPPRPLKFRPGDALAGRPEWLLDRVLGVGGFGEVWLVRHIDMGVEAAVKFCHGPHASDLRHESQVIAQVMKAGEHPCVVPLRDAVLTGETPWLRFDYVDGGDLGDWIRLLHRQPAGERPKYVVQALRQIATAVGTFHRLTPAVIHRDLKPSNILYDRSSKRIKVTDFGIGAVTAKATLADEARGAATASGRMLSSHRGSHTPIYAGPQQRAGADPDARDDVHAIGVIAYQMLTGHLSLGPGPDYTHDLVDVGTPQNLIELIGRCVAQNPARRPATAADLAKELGDLASVNATVPPTSPIIPARPVVPPEPIPSVNEKPPTTEVATEEDEVDEEAAATTAVSQDTIERELDVVVSGNWRMNRVVRPYARWKLVTKLPARVKVRIGEVYKLDIMRSARDANVQGLSNLIGIDALHELDLTGCKRLTDEGFSIAAKLTQVRNLFLSESSINDNNLKLFSKLPQIETLVLEDAPITDAGLVNVRTLRTIINLRLGGCDICDAGLIHLAPLRQLRTLDVQSIPITDSGLLALSGLSRLEALGLAFTNVTDNGMNHLLSLSKLQSLDLEETQITEFGIAQLATMKKLEMLWLTKCKGITDRGLSLLGRMKSLGFLDISNTSVTDAGIAQLKGAPNLTMLSLEECPGVTDASLEHLSAMTNLVEVNLVGSAVTAEAANRLCEALPNCTVYHHSFGKSETSDPELEDAAGAE